MSLIGSKSDSIPAQEEHHSHERGTLVAVNKSMILRQAKCVSRGT
jgi:hypothetical protein